jgi:hypothetical protein
VKLGFARFTFLGLAIGSYAQIATTTRFLGTVTDSSGSAVVGAKVTETEAAAKDRYLAAELHGASPPMST